MDNEIYFLFAPDKSKSVLIFFPNMTDYTCILNLLQFKIILESQFAFFCVTLSITISFLNIL